MNLFPDFFLIAFFVVYEVFILGVVWNISWRELWKEREQRRKRNMETKLEKMKPKDLGANVVCTDPKKLLAEWEKADSTFVETNDFRGALGLIQGSYLERTWEHGGCTCKPYREEVAKLNRKIQEIDAKEHPILDRMASLTRPYAKEWLIEKVRAGEVTHDQLNYAYMMNGEPLTQRFVADVIAGWRPMEMRSK